MKILLQFILLEIIHLTTVNSMGQTLNADDECPADWMFNPTNSRCYLISNQYARFDIAAKKCESMQSYLSSIFSLDEQIFVNRLLDKEKSNNSNYWLGLRNSSSNRIDLASWTWIDGSPFTNRMSFWGEKLPSGKYDCGSLSPAKTSAQMYGYWEDIHCDKPLRYICKKAANGNAFAKQLSSTFSLMKEMYFKASGHLTPIDLDCPKGWFTVHPFTSCFYLGKDDVKYNIAEESCKSRSSVLAKLHSVEELKSVAKWIALERNTCLYYEVCSQFWIGLRFVNVASRGFSSWMWGDGTSVLTTENVLTIASFGSETPADKLQQCATLQIGDGGNEPSYAVVSNCANSLRYICRKDLICPDGFVLVPKLNSCYKLITETMNWTDASKMCQNISPGVHLATIFSQAENEAIISLFEREISNNPSVCKSEHTGWSPNAWIGAKRTLENCSEPVVWMPTDKVQIPLNYTYWFQLQPSCDHGIGHCVHITQIWSYRWNDHPCSERKCALCQRRFEKRI